MSKRKPGSEQDIVNAFADLFDELVPETPEEVDATLREAGFDPERIAAKFKATAEAALRDSPLNWRNRVAEERHRAAEHLQRVESLVHGNRADLLIMLEKLAKRWPAEYQLATVQFRNLEDVSDEDLQKLLAELLYLEHPTDVEDSGA